MTLRCFLACSFLTSCATAVVPASTDPGEQPDGTDPTTRTLTLVATRLSEQDDVTLHVSPRDGGGFAVEMTTLGVTSTLIERGTCQLAVDEFDCTDGTNAVAALGVGGVWDVFVITSKEMTHLADDMTLRHLRFSRDSAETLVEVLIDLDAAGVATGTLRTTSFDSISEIPETRELLAAAACTLAKNTISCDAEGKTLAIEPVRAGYQASLADVDGLETLAPSLDLR